MIVGYFLVALAIGVIAFTTLLDAHGWFVALLLTPFIASAAVCLILAILEIFHRIGKHSNANDDSQRR